MKFARIGAALAAALFSLAPIAAYAQSVLASQTVTFENYTALKAVPFARFTTYKPSVIIRGTRGGLFEVVTSNQSALRTLDPQECVFIPSPQDTSGASGGYVRKAWYENGESYVDVTWCGAVADWNSGAQTGTDNAAAIEAAYDLALNVFVPSGSYRVASQLDFDRTAGAKIIGEDRNTTAFVATATSGCAVYLAGRLWTFTDLSVYAGDARWAETDYDEHGICVGSAADGDSASAATHTQSYMARVNVYNQPGDGIHWIGTSSNSVIEQVQVSGNKRNGMMLSGDTSGARFGIMNINNISAKDNGGYAIALGIDHASAGTPSTGYRVQIDNPELGNNAWNYSALATAFGHAQYENASVYLRCQQCSIANGGIGDTAYNGTTVESSPGLSSSGARTAKASPGNAIWIDSASTQIAIRENRFLMPASFSSVSPIYSEGGASGIHVVLPYLNGLPNYILETSTNVKGIYVEVGEDLLDDATLGWDNSPIDVGTGSTGILVMEDVVYKIDPTVANDYITVAGSLGANDASDTISSGVIAYERPYMVVTPESGTADTLDEITGGSTGDLLVLGVTSGDTITFSNNVGTNKMWLGSDLVIDDATSKLVLMKVGNVWHKLALAMNSGRFALGGVETDEIASDTIDYLAPFMQIDVEGGVATSDNLDCIVGGQRGDILVLRTTSGARNVQIVHNQSCASGLPLYCISAPLMDANTDILTLINLGAGWACQSFLANG